MARPRATFAEEPAPQNPEDPRILGCHARLSDYLDDELAAAERAGMEAHVRACDHCARFGGVFASVVQALRGQLSADGPSDEARRRLLERL